MMTTTTKDDLRLDAIESITHIVVARARLKSLHHVDAMKPARGWFAYEGKRIQDETSVMLEDEHMVLTHDWAHDIVCHEGEGFGDARLHAPKASPQGRIGGGPTALDFDDAKVVGQGGKHRPWMQRYDLHDRTFSSSSSWASSSCHCLGMTSGLIKRRCSGARFGHVA